MIENSHKRKFNQNKGFYALQEYQAPRQKTTEKAISKLESSQQEDEKRNCP
jgi:hypothetical protein